jgi:hypothetical protein
MINFNLCRKCDHCGVFDKGEESDTGGLEIRPSVMCNLSGDTLLMNSNAPKGCPYSLEHKLVTQDIPRGFANYMSGHRRSS